MNILERGVIDLLLNITTVEQFNAFMGDPRTVAIIIGILVSVSGALLGVFLLLRKMSLTSDAISHTVLLGIVGAFLFMGVVGLQPDISSPLLIIGAAAAGVLTVVVTELIYRSGLVKADAALGLTFPLLFAIAVILISRFADDVHLDEDAVMVGEIGVAWANTNSYCLENCDDIVITIDDPRAEIGRTCSNCAELDINPRHPDAVFEETCFNCGTYTAAEAWRNRLVDESPQLVFFPKSISVMTLITIINLLFVVLLYKELKISTFDSALAATLGFRPGLINYLLMILVSVTAVGAFDAVGSILVVAFFIIPAATAYLLTDRLSVMLIVAAVGGGLAAFTGYDLARGTFLFVINMEDVLIVVDRIVGLDGYTEWNTSISASMVMMSFAFFLIAWVLSPRYGLISSFIRRRLQRQNFATQLLLGHIYNHQGTARAESELAVATLHEHLDWSPARVQRILAQARALNWIQVEDGIAILTQRGEQQVQRFVQQNLVARKV